MNVMNVMREIAESVRNELFDTRFDNDCGKVFKNKNIRKNNTSKFKYASSYNRAFSSNNNGVYYTDVDPFSYYVYIPGNEVFKDNWHKRISFNLYGWSDRKLRFDCTPYTKSSKERKKYYIARIQL